MAEQHRNDGVEISRRTMMFGGAAVFAAGAVAAVAGEKIVEAIDDRLSAEPKKEQPLGPGFGYAEEAVRIDWLPDTVTRWNDLTEKWSLAYDVDPNLTAILMTIESGGDPKANSGVATGLMQITDVRAKDIASKFLHSPRKRYNLKDPNTNIEFGVANIRHLVDEYGSPDQAPTWDETVALVAAGYFGGEGAANIYQSKGLTALPQGTYAYVRYATTMWRERHDDKSFAYRYWYDQGNGQALVQAAQK